MPILMSPLSSPGVYGYSVVDRHAVTHDLSWETSPRLFVTAGSTGLGTPPVDVSADKMPFTAGALVRHIATQPRRMEIPLAVFENTIPDLIAKVDEVRDWFWTGDEARRSPIYFRVTRPDGLVRQLHAYYLGGLEGDMAAGSPTYAKYVISLAAYDPWPVATDEESAEWLLTDPDLPTVSIINDGDLGVYPVWTITGPCTLLNVNNLTNGKGWLYTSDLVGFNLAAGKTLTIDMRHSPPRTTIEQVYDSDGVNRFSSFHPLSSISALEPGQNNLNVVFAGHSGDSKLRLTWLPKYFGFLR